MMFAIVDCVLRWSLFVLIVLLSSLFLFSCGLHWLVVLLFALGGLLDCACWFICFGGSCLVC